MTRVLPPTRKYIAPFRRRAKPFLTDPSATMSFFGGHCFELDGGASFQDVSASFGHAMDPQQQAYLPTMPLYAIIPGEYQVVGVAPVLHYDANSALQLQGPDSSQGSSSRKGKSIKWYERGPQAEPTDEERRQRALKAKEHRQRRKQREEQIAQQTKEVNDEITNLRAEYERRSLTCMSLERALDEATQNYNVVDYSKYTNISHYLHGYNET